MAADLELVFQIAGLDAVESKYKEVVRASEEGHAAMAEAGVRAAEVMRESAQRTAGGVAEAAEVAGGGKTQADLEERLLSAIFGDYRKLGGQLQDLQAAMKDFARIYDDEGEPEDAEAKPDLKGEKDKTKETKRKGIMGAIDRFLAVGKQAETAFKRGADMIGGALPLGVGGVVGMMLYGLYDQDRLRAGQEAYTQLWDSVLSTSGGKVFEEGHRYSKALAKDLQDLVKTYEVSEQEASATVAAMAANGIDAKAAADTTVFTVGGVKANVLMASVAIDQTFRLHAGTAAQMAGDYITKYGGTIAAATNEIGMLAVAGRESGVGVQTFMNQAYQATGQVREYGARLGDTIAIAQTFREQLEKGGLDHNFAGDLAMMMTGQVAAGVHGMSKGMAIMVAQQLGEGVGIAGYQALRDKLMDPNLGPDQFRRIVVGIVDIAKRGTARTEGQLSFLLQSLMPQLDVNTATTLIRSVETLRDTNVSAEKRAEAEGAFNDAFAQEKRRTESWRIAYANLMRAVSKLGFSLFDLMINGFAQIVLLIREAPIALTEYIGDSTAVRALAFAAGGPLGFAAVEAIGGTLSPEDKRARKRIHALRDRATAAAEQDVARIGSAWNDVTAALAAISQDAPESLAGINALTQAFGTPDAIRKMAERAHGPVAAMFETTEQALAPILARSGGGRAAVTTALSPELQLRLESAARNRDFSTVQSLLGMSAYVAPGGAREVGYDPEDIAVTGISFGPVANDGSATVAVTIRYGVAGEGTTGAALRTIAERHYRAGRHSPKGRTRVPDAPMSMPDADPTSGPPGSPFTPATDIFSVPSRGAEPAGVPSPADQPPVLAAPTGELGIQAAPFAAAADPRYGSQSWQTGAGGGRVHMAADMFAPMGTPVYSTVPGIVRRVVPGSSGPERNNQSWVIVEGPGGNYHGFMHLRGQPEVHEGQRVAPGDLLGYLGRAYRGKGGAETSPHLHYQVMRAPTQQERAAGLGKGRGVLAGGGVPVDATAFYQQLYTADPRMQSSDPDERERARIKASYTPTIAAKGLTEAQWEQQQWNKYQARQAQRGGRRRGKRIAAAPGRTRGG